MFNEPVARYFPLASGHYAIQPGFYRLGHDFGNGQADGRLFQLDHQFASYRQAKQDARNEDPDKYICFTERGRSLEPAVNRFLLQHLPAEYPHWFQLCSRPSRQLLHCRATGDKLIFSADAEFLGQEEVSDRLVYQGGMDALALQVQEDLALIELEGDENRLCAIHLCQPNHWDPRNKIGQNFTDIHAPVPEMTKINNRASQLLLACLQHGPFVRFAWGIATDTRLNHHPVPPPDFDPLLWQGRDFDRNSPQAWLRVERQCLWGLPEINSVIFTIRTYHYAVDRLTTEQQCLLHQAIAGMQEPVLEYKGLISSQAALLDWLGGLCQGITNQQTEF